MYICICCLLSSFLDFFLDAPSVECVIFRYVQLMLFFFKSFFFWNNSSFTLCTKHTKIRNLHIQNTILYYTRCVKCKIYSFSIRTIFIWRFCLLFASNAKSRSLGVNISPDRSRLSWGRRRYIERPIRMYL